MGVIFTPPKVEEALILEFAAEKFADAGPGNAEARILTGRGLEDEGVAEEGEDRGWLDVRALGQGARAAPLVPMGE